MLKSVVFFVLYLYNYIITNERNTTMKNEIFTNNTNKRITVINTGKGFKLVIEIIAESLSDRQIARVEAKGQTKEQLADMMKEEKRIASLQGVENYLTKYGFTTKI